LWAVWFASSISVRPMNFSRAATSFLWIAPLAMQCVIALVMVRRGLVEQFPFFFSYTLLLPLRDFTLYFLPNPGDRYSIVYWSGEGVAVLLSLGVVFELVGHFTRPYPLLIWGKGPSGADLAFERIILLERSARFLQVCLLIVAIALMSRLGLTWHHYSLGIAAGFGVYSALDLILLELRAHLHLVTDAAFVLLRPAAYNLGVLIWAFYFLRPQNRDPVDRLPGTDLEDWNDAVTEHMDKWYRR
jgi:hypothetical protein